MKQIAFIFIFLISFLIAGFKTDFDSHKKDDSILELYRIFKNISPQDSVLNILMEPGVHIDTLSEEEVTATSMHIDTIKNTIRIENYYKVGNSSFCISEYKALKLKHATKFYFSQLVGTPAFTAQDEFQVYDYNSVKNKFTIDSLSMKFFDVTTRDYFYPNTPDSIITEFLTHSSNFYHLVYNTDGIAEKIIVDELISNNLKENKWLLGNTIRFTLKDNKVVRSVPFFDE